MHFEIKKVELVVTMIRSENEARVTDGLAVVLALAEASGAADEAGERVTEGDHAIEDAAVVVFWGW